MGSSLESTIGVSGPPVARVSKRRAAAKRGEDFLLSIFFIVVGSPLLLIIALLIKIDSPGPIFFLQPRRGLNGRPFKCVKFRTMYTHASDVECRQQTGRDDPRVTRVGKILRRRSLDELPQLFNVLIGQMSIVGPRPHALGTSIDGRLLEHVVDDYMLRYQVKPGITGWAQVNGSRGALDTAEKLNRRVELDIYYINKWSVWLDIRIVVRTMFCLIDDKDAF